MSAQPAPTNELSAALRDGLEGLASSQRFTADQLEVIYALAYTHLQQQQWRQALGLFAFLSQYGPTRRHYLAGLAQCLRMLERHDEAINIWTLILVLHPEDLAPSLQVAQCQLAMGDPSAARQTLRQLDAALEGHDPLKPRVKTLLEQLG